MLPAILTGLRATSASTEVKLLAHDWITLWSLHAGRRGHRAGDRHVRVGRDRWVQGRSGARTVRIRELLADDDDVDQDATGVEIGYRLRGVHMALTAWYPEESVSISTNLPAVLIRDFASVVDGPLLVAADHHAAWDGCRSPTTRWCRASGRPRRVASPGRRPTIHVRHRPIRPVRVPPVASGGDCSASGGR